MPGRLETGANRILTYCHLTGTGLTLPRFFDDSMILVKVFRGQGAYIYVSVWSE